MARTKKSQREQLIETLRANGLRKKVAEQVASAVGRAPKRKPPKQVMDLLGGLRSVTSDIEDRITGGPKKRSAAAKKAANTRKRAATKRSASAKKGAATRAKSSSNGRSKSTKSTGTRAKAKR